MDSSDGSDGDDEGVSVHASAYSETQLEALADGQPAAFEQFYRDHHARIYNLAARIVGDPDDAADITQEVFLRAYTHPLQAGGDVRPEPWLYRIAVNASYDHLRRRAARPSTSLEAVPEVAAQGDGFAAAETTQLVEGCLAGLTPRYRTALVLKDLHGLSHAEIAEVMGIHQGAARVLLHRARAAFRRAFRGAAPSGAGGVTTLGLAAFLPELPVPASLQTPPLPTLVPPATVPAGPPPDLVGPATGGGHSALSGGVPAAAAPVAAAPLAPAGLLAGLGGAVAAKVAVAVIATVGVAGGGLAVGHYSETPASLDAAANATRAGAATSSLAVPATAPWTQRQMIRERLQSAGLAPRSDEGLGGAGATTRAAPARAAAAPARAAAAPVRVLPAQATPAPAAPRTGAADRAATPRAEPPRGEPARARAGATEAARARTLVPPAGRAAPTAPAGPPLVTAVVTPGPAREAATRAAATPAVRAAPAAADPVPLTR